MKRLPYENNDKFSSQSYVQAYLERRGGETIKINKTIYHVEN